MILPMSHISIGNSIFFAFLLFTMGVLLCIACISPEGHFVIEFPKHLIIKADGPLRGLP